MKKRYFHVDYQWPPGCRGCEREVVAVPNDGSPTTEMAKVAIERLNKHIGQEVHVLRYNKLPSNYKPMGCEIE